MPQAPSFSVQPQSITKENQPPRGFSTQPAFFLPGSKTAANESRKKVQTLSPLTPLLDAHQTTGGSFYPNFHAESGLLTPQTPSNTNFAGAYANYGTPVTRFSSSYPSFDNSYYYSQSTSQSSSTNGILSTAPNSFYDDTVPPSSPEWTNMEAVYPDLSPLGLDDHAALPPSFRDQPEISAGITDQGTSGSRRKKHTSKAETIAAAHKMLGAAQITPTMFLIHILEAAQQRTAQARIGEAFFREKNEENICRLLDLIMDNHRGADTLKRWMQPHAVELVRKTVHREMKAAKCKLRMTTAETTPEFIDTWDLNKIMDEVSRDYTPTWTAVLKAATEPKFISSLDPEGSENLYEDRHTTQNIISAQVHYLRSFISAKVQTGLGLMAWSTGASRNLLNVLHKAGLSVSYRSITTIIANLRDHSLQKAVKISRERHVLTYDNMNTSASNHYEQRPGAMNKVQSGTFPVIYSLDGVNPEHMKLAPLTANLKKSQPLELDDLRRSVDCKYAFQTYINVAKILFKYSSNFDFLSSDPRLQNTPRRLRPPGKTRFYPLSVSTIEEATITGNLQVHDNIYIDQLRHDPGSTELNDYAIPSLNDQLTNARIRGAQSLRSKDVNAWERREIFQLAFGTFHLIMNLIWAILHTHKGTAGQPGCLSNYFSLLEKARLCNDRPEYYPLLAALTQIIEGLIFNAWRSECGHSSLDAFATSKPTADDILRIAQTIVEKYATPRRHVVRTEAPAKKRKSGDTDGDEEDDGTTPETTAAPSTDHTHSNTILLTRDLLYVVELISAISAGDFGRIEDVLPEIACIFRGAGSNNYSMEILHLLFNIKEVWTPEFSNIMRDTMLVNPTGLEGRNMGIDMNIEHLIGYLKALFAAKGIYSSWDRLGDISAAVNYLQRIKKQVTTSLDSGYQSSSHTKPDTSMLVMRVANRVRDLKLQEIVANRRLRSTDGKDQILHATPVPDLHRVGYRKFGSGTLDIFNNKIDEYKKCLFSETKAGPSPEIEVEEADEIPAMNFDSSSLADENPFLD